MSYTIAVPSSSITKVLNYGIPSITASAGGVSVANGAATITSTYPPLPPVNDPAFTQANVATGIATSSYNQANTATNLAQTVFNYANTIQGGSAVDNVARVLASSASANTIILQGVNITQNTRLNSIETINTNQNTTIGIIQGVDLTQNANISIIQGVDVTQNTRLSSIETNISIIQGVDAWQNTQITAVNGYAAGAFSAANTALSSISGGGISAIDSVARTTANGANGLAQGAYNTANSASSAAAAATFPSGTALLFQQSAAPTGWTKVTTHNDKALRVVSGSAGSGGSVAFSSAFTSRSVTGTTDGTTLSTSQIPAHAHVFPGDDQLANANGIGGWTNRTVTSWNYDAVSSGGGGQIYYTSDTGGGGSHSHTFTGNAIDLSVAYVDVIIATKN